jgi:hypothetical protein
MKVNLTKVLYNAWIEQYDGARAPLCLLTFNFRHFSATPGGVFFFGLFQGGYLKAVRY